ncbi:hypothetical protein ACFE04_030695 [Oxalis oulophora]
MTSFESVVDKWIAQTLRITRNELCNVLIGLDTEFKLPQRDRRQPVAIDHKCLIFQLCHDAKSLSSKYTSPTASYSYAIVRKGKRMICSRNTQMQHSCRCLLDSRYKQKNPTTENKAIESTVNLASERIVFSCRENGKYVLFHSVFSGLNAGHPHYKTRQ